MISPLWTTLSAEVMSSPASPVSPAGPGKRPPEEVPMRLHGSRASGFRLPFAFGSSPPGWPPSLDCLSKRRPLSSRLEGRSTNRFARLPSAISRRPAFSGNRDVAAMVQSRRRGHQTPPNRHYTRCTAFQFSQVHWLSPYSDRRGPEGKELC